MLIVCGSLVDACDIDGGCEDASWSQTRYHGYVSGSEGAAVRTRRVRGQERRGRMNQSAPSTQTCRAAEAHSLPRQALPTNHGRGFPPHSADEETEALASGVE